MALLRDLALVAGLGAGGIRSLARAMVELAIARRRLASPAVRARLRRDSEGHDDAPVLSPRQLQLVDRITYAIPRVAARLPWRADCMVQALAAERWLRCNGIASRLVVGVADKAALPASTDPSPLDAHAWLQVGERIVTGGDISGFARLGR